MKSKLLSFLILTSLLLILSGPGLVLAKAGQPPPPLPDPSKPPVLVPDDIMPSPNLDPASSPGSAAAGSTSYSVLPILFVPSDLTPNAYGLRYINQRMQLIQRWYAEQLRGRTFTLQPAILVRGSQPLSFYYGNCFPADNSCDWTGNLWNNIFDELPAQGYPYESNVIHGVFFQHNGMGAPALGGGGLFLVALDSDNNRLNGDCLEPGCASSVAKGGAAHELGHAFGLPHTLDDPEGSPGISLMNYGFYNFPQATLVNTATNPERNTLYASPFLNVQMSLTDAGFEDCLANWSVISGTADCSGVTKRSGLSGLSLSPTSGNNVQVRQQISGSQRTYDISAWINSPDAGNHHVWIQMTALNAGAQILSSQVFGDTTGATEGWQRIAYSFTAPAQTISLRVQINASGSDTTTIYVDDVDVHETKLIPPIPLQMFYFDRDTVNGALPTLQWDDATSTTNYQLQVGTDNSFSSPIWDTNVTSPFFHIPSGLNLNSRYFWRVRASNGTGTSDWSSTWSFVTAGPQDYSSDEFESLGLDPSWSWVREDPTHWYLGGPAGRRSFGYIGITLQAGDLLGADNSAKNLLLRAAPQGNFEMSTKIDFWEPGPSVNYQQAGLLLYQDDNNYLKLVRAYNNGNQLEWLAEVDGVVVTDATIATWNNPPIRITRSGNQYSAKYSADGITWITLGSPVTVDWSNPKMGLAAFSRLDVQQITAFFDYFRVTADATTQATIGGNTGVAGVMLGYVDSTPKTVLSQTNGSYLFTVPRNWSGIVTPTHPCFTFTPGNRSYTNIGGNQTAQNYSAAIGSGCADINVLVNGANQGRFGLPAHGSTRASFAGVNNGPVKIVSTNSIPLIGAERVIYKVNGINTSFTEMMALPNGQLDKIYWLPWYNNVDLDTQLRIGNVSGTTATVHIFIGGAEVTPVSGLSLGAGASTRLNYPGVNNGPVKIQSNQNVVAAERLIYKFSGINTSFAEMMALPNSQLNTTYWLPWYNNLDLDTQLRIGNVGGNPATIHIFIGGAEVTPVSGLSLGAGASTRLSYPGVNNGPVKIQSDHGIPIVAAERVIYRVNSVNTSFTEMMALPNSQLNTTYSLPWYNNADLDTQLRFGNVSSNTAHVHIYIGGIEMGGSPFTLGVGQSTRVSFAGVNNGPVKIDSDQNIVAAERLIYKVNNIPTSFSEMMALPNSQLNPTYWLPWYNNFDLDTQLRFGVP